MIRLCICGGRNYFNKERIYKTLDYIHKHKPFILISGGATGADTIGIKWSQERNIVCEVYPAKWKEYGRSAGPIRNKKMLDSRLDILIAFEGGIGTQNMIDICTKAGVPVIKVSDMPEKVISTEEGNQ